MIRFAKPQDVDALMTLCGEHAEFEQSLCCLEGKRKQFSEMLFGELGTVSCIVVEANSQILGYASFMKQYSTWLAGNYLYLDCLYLKPDARNQGIGRELVKLIYAQAVEWKCSEIQWQTPKFNVGAIRFYDRLTRYKKEKLRYTLPVQSDSAFNI